MYAKVFKPKLIGIVGQKGSGKDTFASLLLDFEPGQAISFAEPIKEFVGDLFNWDMAFLNGPSEFRDDVDERYDITPRQALREVGDAIRSLYPNAFAEYGVRRANYFDGQLVIITDVRYTNEAQAIKDNGGHIVRLVRNKLNSEDIHSSESEQLSEEMAKLVDYTVNNNGDLYELKMSALTLLNKL